MWTPIRVHFGAVGANAHRTTREPPLAHSFPERQFLLPNAVKREDFVGRLESARATFSIVALSYAIASQMRTKCVW